MSNVETVSIAITLADDTVAVMRFVTEERGDDGSVRWRRIADTAAIDAEVARCAFDADKRPIKGWRPIDPRDVPQDRTYRNALRDDGKALGHDVAHVRRIILASVREDRALLMPDLDVAWMRAAARGETQLALEVEAQRQTLRDLPAVTEAALAAATSVEELTALRPNVRVAVGLTATEVVSEMVG